MNMPPSKHTLTIQFSRTFQKQKMFIIFLTVFKNWPEYQQVDMSFFVNAFGKCERWRFSNLNWIAGLFIMYGKIFIMYSYIKWVSGSRTFWLAEKYKSTPYRYHTEEKIVPGR